MKDSLFFLAHSCTCYISRSDKFCPWQIGQECRTWYRHVDNHSHGLHTPRPADFRLSTYVYLKWFPGNPSVTLLGATMLAHLREGRKKTQTLTLPGPTLQHSPSNMAWTCFSSVDRYLVFPANRRSPTAKHNIPTRFGDKKKDDVGGRRNSFYYPYHFKGKKEGQEEKKCELLTIILHTPLIFRSLEDPNFLWSICVCVKKKKMCWFPLNRCHYSVTVKRATSGSYGYGTVDV